MLPIQVRHVRREGLCEAAGGEAVLCEECERAVRTSNC